jgi:hypothetical protein
MPAPASVRPKSGRRPDEDWQDRLASTRRSLPPGTRLGSCIGCVCQHPTEIGTGINRGRESDQAENEDLKDFLPEDTATASIRISSYRFSTVPKLNITCSASECGPSGGFDGRMPRGQEPFVDEPMMHP